MQTKTYEKLRVLLANARRELQEVADDHGGFLNQLRLIQRSVDAHEPSDEELEATLRAFRRRCDRCECAGVPPPVKARRRPGNCGKNSISSFSRVKRTGIMHDSARIVGRFSPNGIATKWCTRNAC